MGAFEKVNVIYCDFQSQISDEDISDLISNKDLECIRPCGGYVPSEKDLYLLNDFFRKRPDVAFRVTCKGQLRYIPYVQNISEPIEGCLGEELEDLKYIKCLKSVSLVEKNIEPLLAHKDELIGLGLEGTINKSSHEILPKLGNLKALYLDSTTLKSFTYISELPIEKLSLYGRQPSDALELEKLSELREINIKNNSNWIDFSFLSKLDKLERIKLSYCAKIEFVPSLDELVRLKYIELSNCNRLIDIQALWKLGKDCNVLATGNNLSKERISYQYDKDLGLADWCKEYSVNIPDDILNR
jgi:hypothetical protein